MTAFNILPYIRHRTLKEMTNEGDGAFVSKILENFQGGGFGGSDVCSKRNPSSLLSTVSAYDYQNSD